MDLANRFAIILLGLLIIFGVAVVTLLVWSAGPDSVDRLGDFVEYLTEHVEEDGFKVIVTLGGVVIALLALLIIFVELAPPEAATVPVRDVKAGDAVLTTDAIARRVQEEVRRLPQVSQGKASALSHGKGVEVSLELQVDPEANLASISEAACQVAQDVVTKQLGVEMAKLPHVKLHFAERRLPADARPTASPPSYTPPSPPARPDETVSSEVGPSPGDAGAEPPAAT